MAGAFDSVPDANIECLWPYLPYVRDLFLASGWKVDTTAQKRAVLNNYWNYPESADRLHYGTVTNLLNAVNCPLPAGVVLPDYKVPVTGTGTNTGTGTTLPQALNLDQIKIWIQSNPVLAMVGLGVIALVIITKE